MLKRKMADTFQNENHPLHNRTLHINGTFKEIEKPDIEIEKPDIDTLKSDMEKAGIASGSRRGETMVFWTFYRRLDMRVAKNMQSHTE